MSAPKVGDRVRVTVNPYEGTVVSAEDGEVKVVGEGLPVGAPQSIAFEYDEPLSDRPGEYAVEVLGPPDPEWWPPQHADIVQGLSGTPLLRFGGEWRHISTPGHRAECCGDVEARRGALLVRDGKPVSS